MKIVFRFAPPVLLGICATVLAVQGCLTKDNFADEVAATTCESAAQCGHATPCASFTCTAQMCKATFEPAGTKLADDKKGDCQRPICNGHGAIVEVPDPTDAPASPDPCVAAKCSARGAIEHSFVPAEARCALHIGGGVCDGMGTCVECIQTTDCPAALGTGYCYRNACASCADGKQDGDETGVDCGGSHCKNCNGEACSQYTDCASQTCSGGKCGWPANVPCTMDAECASLKCTNGVCTM